MDGRYIQSISTYGCESTDKLCASSTCWIRSCFWGIYGKSASHLSSRDVDLRGNRDYHHNGASYSLLRLLPKRKLPDIRKRSWMFCNSILSNNWDKEEGIISLHLYRRCRRRVGPQVPLQRDSKEWDLLGNSSSSNRFNNSSENEKGKVRGSKKELGRGRERDLIRHNLLQPR